MREVSDSAYVHRMFDLVYGLCEPSVLTYLTEDESKAVTEFNDLFDSLPWRPLSAHPHISELPNDDLSLLEAPARKIDRIVWLRVGRGIIPIVYRLFRGWRITEPKQKEDTKPAQPGATDNPDDAQRLREDH